MGRAPLILLRDDGRPKLSIFDLERRIRHVYYLRRQDFQREMDAMDHFAALGFGVPALLGRDEGRLCYQQRIIREPFRRDSRAVPADVEAQIQRLAAATRPDWMPVPAYLDRCLDAVRAIEDALSAGQRRRLGGALDELAACDSRFIGGAIPMRLCHGDMSMGNVLIGDDGRVYLNDFDRSFVANAWFDAVYYCRTSGLGRESETRMVNAVTRAIRGGSVLNTEVEQSRVALLTAMDLAVYVHDRMRDVPSGPDRVCRFSLDLMGQIVGR